MPQLASLVSLLSLSYKHKTTGYTVMGNEGLWGGKIGFVLEYLFTKGFLV